MATYLIKTVTPAIGLTMLALNPPPSPAAQKHHQYHTPVQPRSSEYGSVPGPAQDPQAATMGYAQKLWPSRPLCDEGGYRIRPCDLSGGGSGGGGM